MSDEIESPEDAEKAEIGIRDREDAAYWRGLEEGRPRWIPVSERLPEENQEVLLCNRFGVSQGYRAKRGKFIDMTSADRDGAYEDAVDVTHWMPLPEPPKP